jgi:hypothetical protein
MAIVFEIRHRTEHLWGDLVRTAPPGWVRTRADDEFLLSVGTESTTGIQLLAPEPQRLRLRIPLFASAADLASLEGFVPQIARAVGGTIHAEDGAECHPYSWSTFLATQVAPQLVRLALAEIPRLLASDGLVIAIEGRSITYFLGKTTLDRLLGLVAPKALYEKIVEVVASVQALAEDPETVVATLSTVSRDRRRWVEASWSPETQSVVPPCDYLVIGHGAESYRVPSRRIADVVRPHGTMLDDSHWLVLPVDEPARKALLERARAAQDDAG